MYLVAWLPTIHPLYLQLKTRSSTFKQWHSAHENDSSGGRYVLHVRNGLTKLLTGWRCAHCLPARKYTRISSSNGSIYLQWIEKKKYEQRIRRGHLLMAVRRESITNDKQISVLCIELSICPMWLHCEWVDHPLKKQSRGSMFKKYRYTIRKTQFVWLRKNTLPIEICANIHFLANLTLEPQKCNPKYVCTEIERVSDRSDFTCPSDYYLVPTALRHTTV